MQIERISVCKKPKLITNNGLTHVSEMNLQKENQNDLFVKSNRNLSFGEEKGWWLGGSFIGGAICGLGAAICAPAALGMLAAGALASAATGVGMAAGGAAAQKADELVNGKDKK